MTQSKEISFNGQNIYIGIDVHLRSWSVSILSEPYLRRQFVQPPSAEALKKYLVCHFPDGNYHAVYESGFTGFSTYYNLTELGIDCIIVNAADVPSTNYDIVMKTDKTDAAKLALSLKNNMLKGIYIQDKEMLDHRSVLRLRQKIQKQIAGYKIAVKHLLYSNGVEIPKNFAKSTTWSNAFTLWLKEVELLSSTNNSMIFLLDNIQTQKANLLRIVRYVLDLAKSEKYASLFNKIYSIPGIGKMTAMHIICEIGSFSRFKNERQFASYLGLIPRCHNSGEKVSMGKKTFRANKHLGTMLIESSWKAIIHDTELCAYYNHQRKLLIPQKAIIKVARKLSNRIFASVKNES
mgnify:CR=1 FL=1